MAQRKAFDPTKASCVLGGISVTGWAPDTKFTVTPNNSRATITEGVDNDVSVNVDSRFSGKLNINLLHNASFNGVLEAWVDQVNLTGNPFFLVSVSDPSGSFLETVGWIEDQAEYGVSQETSTRTWVIGLADSRMQPTRTAALALLAYTDADTLQTF